MLLVLTNTNDATADYLCGRMAVANVDFVRLDTDTDLSSLSVEYRMLSPRLRIGSQWFSPDDIRSVWYRRPTAVKPELDAEPAEVIHLANEWAGALEGFLAHIPLERWINHPSCNVAASQKIEQISRASSCGLRTPSTLLTQDAIALRQFWRDHDQQVVVKPLVSGCIERDNPEDDTLIYTRVVPPAFIDDPGSLRACPTLFQAMIHKHLDVRVCIIDHMMHAVGMRATEPDGHQRLDIRRNDMEDIHYTTIDVPFDVNASLSLLMGAYRLRFAAVDLAIDTAGHWWFFEVNPNGQWAWLDLAGAADIGTLFIRTFQQ